MDGITGENLLQLLERRLDNIVYRAGFAGSRKEARQMVKHSHFLVDGKKVDIPSFLVKPGMVIEVREKKPELCQSERLSGHSGRPWCIRVDRTGKNLTLRLLLTDCLKEKMWATTFRNT